MLYGPIGLALSGALALASIALTVIAHIVPEFANHRMSLLTVIPTSKPGVAPKPEVAGQIITLGIFGHCGNSTNSTKPDCVSSLNPAASNNLTFLGLPDGLSDILVPSHSWTALFWVALCSWFLGILFAFISVTVQKSDVKFWTNLMTQIGFFFGFMIWLSAFNFFLKSVDDFNACLRVQSTQAPALFAQLGSVFILMASAYACCIGIYILTRG